MKGYWFSSIAGTGLLLFSLAGGAAVAQEHTGEEWRMHLFEKVRADLDHVESTGFRWGDRRRIERARTELSDLQSKLAAHRYDERELDDSIGAVQEVVQDNRLGPRERDRLNEDLNRMREYREHHEQWFR